MPTTFASVTIGAVAGGLGKTARQLRAANHHKAFVEVHTNGIAWRDDGTAPTATVGHLVAAGGTITIRGISRILAFQAIRSGGADATLRVTYSAGTLEERGA